MQDPIKQAILDAAEKVIEDQEKMIFTDEYEEVETGEIFLGWKVTEVRKKNNRGSKDLK